MNNRGVHLEIHGDVIGVGFRWRVRNCALELGLAGFVRNTSRGTVEVVAEGNSAALQRLLAWCEGGATGARVDEVQKTWQTSKGEYSQFEIR